MSSQRNTTDDQDKTGPEKELIDKSSDSKHGSKSQINTEVKTSSQKKSIAAEFRMAIYALLFGLAFGLFMNKGMVFVSPTIRQQMIFQRFAMLKMFLAAAGTSMLSVALLCICCSSVYTKIFNGYVEHNSRRGLLHYIFGGTMIGLGMVTCGSCPGTVFIQIGSGVVYSLFTALGGLLGTLFYYGCIHESISQTKLSPNSLVLNRVSDLIHVPSIAVHLGMGLILVCGSVAMEFIFPWKNDLNPRLLQIGTINPAQSLLHIFGMAAWPPAACGAGVGFLQLFFIFFLEKSLGVSSAFTVFAAQLCRIKPIAKALPALSSFTYGMKNYVAAIFALAAISGSALSCLLSGTFPLGPENGTNILSSILGGFLLLVGARVAGGCTSGQGISGMTHLLLGSFIATAGMFGGGIIFGFNNYFTNSEWRFENL